jgi:IMP and pyridine-specific 5'-nucleotidase
MSTYTSSEWIKALLAVPFVIHSQPTGVFESRDGTVAQVCKSQNRASPKASKLVRHYFDRHVLTPTLQMAEEAHRRYAEIMLDVERMIDDHSKIVCPFDQIHSNMFDS